MFEDFKKPKGYVKMNENKKNRLKDSFFTKEYEKYKEKKKNTQKRKEKITKYGSLTLIIGICTILFLPRYISLDSYIWLVENFGLQPLHSEKFGIWQIFTSMWLHGGLLHLTLNMIVFWSFASPIKKLWGDDKLIIIYIISGLGGSILMLLLGIVYPYNLGVGASGAICGLIGAMVILNPNIKVLLFFIIPMKIKNAVIGFAVFSFIMIIFNWLTGIGHAAHLGGLVVGYLIALYWKNQNDETRRKLHTLFKIKLYKNL